MVKQIFGVPPQARRAKPFLDHILTFSIVDSKIWFRNFQVKHVSKNLARLTNDSLLLQIVEKDPLQPNGPPETSLVEIGPRFVLTPIRIFEGAFGGATVFANPGTHHPAAADDCDCLVVLKRHFIFFAEFVSPALVRSARRKEKGERYKERKLAQEERGVRQTERKREEDPLAVAKVFA